MFLCYFLIPTNGDNKLPPLSRDLFSNWNFVNVQDLDNRQTGLISIICQLGVLSKLKKYFAYMDSTISQFHTVHFGKKDRFWHILRFFSLYILAPLLKKHQHRTRHSQNRVFVPSSKVAKCANIKDGNPKKSAEATCVPSR